MTSTSTQRDMRHKQALYKANEKKRMAKIKPYPLCAGAFPECVGYDKLKEEDKVECRLCPWRKKKEE